MCIRDRYVTWNGLSNQIDKIDDTVDSAAQVYLQTNPASGSNLPLTFTAPVLGPEMQLPTKSAAAPTTLAWSQGDTEQNSGATANGVAAWVNVGAGTPGTWAGIPLGNSSGQIAVSQLAPASLQGTDTKAVSYTHLICPSRIIMEWSDSGRYLQRIKRHHRGQHDAGLCLKFSGPVSAALHCNIYCEQ